MKKNILLILVLSLLVSVSNLLFAQSIGINEAKVIAKNHLLTLNKTSSNQAKARQRSFSFSAVKAAVQNKDTLFYILNDTINKSFVIVAADQRVWPILGYSLDGSYNENNQPPAFTAWMENREKEIAYIKQNNLQPDSKTSQEWANLNSANSDQTAATGSVEPLLKTTWGQGPYYNDLCPAENGVHVPTGCVATAMAQIMKYWNYPTVGTGSQSYFHPVYGDLSANFGETTYQWNQMPDNVTIPINAVATLMYHCGVALQMQYSLSNSSSFCQNAVKSLSDFFNYSKDYTSIRKHDINNDNFLRLLRSELDSQKPILVAGIGNGSHAFICDGYQNNGYFHFNWGWDGSADGYYYMADLYSQNMPYNESQEYYLNICPDNLPQGFNNFYTTTSKLNLTAWQSSSSFKVISSVKWTASSDQAWLKLNQNNGTSGSSELTITAQENITDKNRKASITVTTSEFGSKTVTIYQTNKTVVSAGDLQNILGNQLDTISFLTLSGTIDVRDFKTMRDKMLFLSEVDLKNVSIAKYIGTEGTKGNTMCTYDENTIPAYAFNTPTSGKISSIHKLVFPSNVKTIDNFAFQSCDELTKIDIPSPIENVKTNAFRTCVSLISVNISSSVNYFDGIPFDSQYLYFEAINVDKNNANYSSTDGVLFDKSQNTIMLYPCQKSGKIYNIPPTVKTIPDGVFSNNKFLRTIIIPPSVQTIANFAFINCIAIPIADANSSNFFSADSLLFNKDQSKTVFCSKLKKGPYKIPSSVKSIGAFSFANSSLDSIVIPNSVTIIEPGAFNCSRIKNINIPSSVTSIGYNAFSFCMELKSIRIPASVKIIESAAFASNSNCILSSITINNPIPPNLGESVFSAVDKTKCIIHVPCGSRAVYQAADQWKDFENIVEMPGIILSFNTVDMGANADTVKIKIISSESWKAISDQAWLIVSPASGEAGSTIIIFTATANHTPTKRTATITFSATGLDTQTTTITQFVKTKIEVTAGNLRSLLAGQQLVTTNSLALTGSIDARDFKTMRDLMPLLAEIDLSGTTIISYSGTEGTSNWGNNNYQANTIPEHAFVNGSYQGKSSLTSFVFPKSVTDIGWYAFYGCSGISEITIPSSLTSVGYGSFTGCSGLSTVTIPLSVTSIGSYAFENCIGLVSISAMSAVPISLSSSGGVFNNIDKATTVLKVPYGSKSAYQSADQWKDFMNIVEMPNKAPVANAGADQTVNEGVMVTLDGSLSSDPDGTAVTYLWTAPAGITLSSATAQYPTFSAPEVTADKTYTLSLVVNDSLLNSAADQVVITVKNGNTAPVANAGTDQIVNEGVIVTLDGSLSADQDGTAFTYLWTAPAGITLSLATARNPTFTAPEVNADKNYTLSLVVNDGLLNSAADQVVITVKNVNKAPTANAGPDQSVSEGTTVTLDGSLYTDPEGSAVTYLWTAPAGITLSSATAQKPTFIAPEVTVDKNYTLSLVVNDGFLNSDADQVVITVKNVNKAPVANAGADQTVNEGVLVSLDGSLSADPDGTAFTYLWTAPAGITLSSATAQKPTFTAPEVTQDTPYAFSLIVNDGTVNSPATTVKITVLNVIKVAVSIVETPVFKQYPNPTTGIITVEFTQNTGKKTEVLVYNQTGSEILQKEFGNSSKFQIDLSNQNSGIYLLKINNGQNQFVKKIIIRKD